MRRSENGRRCLVGIIAGGLLLTTAAWVQANPKAVELLPGDCIKCHDKAPADIAKAGRAHKEKVSCVDCHVGHPPRSKDIIPKCSNCHADTPHFKLQGCTGCHNNPHTPLVVTVPSGITDPCLTCHSKQMSQLQEYVSKHTTVACSTCHRERHGLIPECTNCHSPHANGQVQKDCLTCHKAHMPKNVTYPSDIASSNCAGCHPEAYQKLKNSSAKHAKLECATCHQEKHKMIPQCQLCHGPKPHAVAMHQAFPQCSQCHGIAHDLHK
ncbi:MAG: cytochrome C [Pseudomonadota bacterium]